MTAFIITHSNRAMEGDKSAFEYWSKQSNEDIIKFSQLSSREKIRFLHLLSQGIILYARGMAADARNSAEVRLSQSDAIIEMLHRIAEQGEHYYKADDAQRQ